MKDKVNQSDPSAPPASEADTSDEERHPEDDPTTDDEVQEEQESAEHEVPQTEQQVTIQVKSKNKSKSKKGVSIQVKFLDDSVTGFRVQVSVIYLVCIVSQYYIPQYKALGKWLLEQVYGMLNLIESDYFGLEYYDPTGTRVSYV